MGDLTGRVRLVGTPEGQRFDMPPGFMLGGVAAEDGRRIVEPVARPSLPFGLAEDWPEIADASKRKNDRAP